MIKEIVTGTILLVKIHHFISPLSIKCTKSCVFIILVCNQTVCPCRRIERKKIQ